MDEASHVSPSMPSLRRGSDGSRKIYPKQGTEMPPLAAQDTAKRRTNLGE